MNGLIFIFWVSLFFLYRWSRKFAKPALYFSKIDDIQGRDWKVNFASFSSKLMVVGLIFLSIAFLDLHTFELQKEKSVFPKEGIAIYLVLDQSGSMESKMGLMKEITARFVKDRVNDMIGLISFARGANVLAPLTLDHESLLKQLKSIEVVKEPDKNGTAIGYAIYKSAHLIAKTRKFAESYAIKNAVIIVVTDGFQSPNPLDKGKRLRNIDIDEAAAYAKENQIKLYIVNVEPKINLAEFAPYRRMLEKATESTGGKFYSVDGIKDLERMYTDINRLEKSVLPNQDSPIISWKKFSYYPLFITIALVCLAAAFLFEGLIIRRVP